MDRISWQARAHYLKHFYLERQTLHDAPWRTVGGALQAAFLEPKYLWSRLMSRFSGDTWEFEETHAALGKLVEDWDVPWPPEVLENS